MSEVTRSAYIALIGRPNVGKSTLLNQLLNKKISITSRKPQTTRQRILGIKTFEHTQMIYVDTPGIHYQEKRALNRLMNRVAKNVLQEVDIIVWVVEAMRWTEDEERITQLLAATAKPIILLINKIDLVKQREQLLPFIDKHSKQLNFAEIIPLCARRADTVTAFEKTLLRYVPAGAHYFSPEQFTDVSDKFIICEAVREQLMRQLGQELPYATAVSIEALTETPRIIKVAAIIWVEKPGQKAIVIGQAGERLKSIGTAARHNLEAFFEKKLLLKLWVKVKTNWSDDQRSLNDLGYQEE